MPRYTGSELQIYYCGFSAGRSGIAKEIYLDPKYQNLRNNRAIKEHPDGWSIWVDGWNDANLKLKPKKVK